MTVNKLTDNIASAVTGTTMMTLFSYVTSYAEQENFSEPEHLSTLIDRLIPGNSGTASRIAGWGAHYVVGLLFVACYQKLWETGAIKKNLGNAVILGLLSGIIGVGIWNMTLKKHPAPPDIDLTKYFLQLVPAHIVLSVGATLTSMLLQKSSEKPIR